MRPNLLRISRTPDRWLVELLECVSTLAHKRAIDYFVVGAIARDVIFELVHNIEAPRRTDDVDLGLRVSSWEEFETIIDGLMGSGRFTKTKAHQRLLFDQVVRLDVVPFGDIADGDLIKWPPDFEIEMDVAGFAEAHGAAIVVRLREAPVLEVPFASPAGLAAMKMLAWADRAVSVREKDAEDLAFLSRHYLDIEGLERVTADFPAWLAGDFDYELSSAELLGIDIQHVMRSGVLDKVLAIVRTQLGHGFESPLVRNMVGSAFEGDALTRALAVLAALGTGLTRPG